MGHATLIVMRTFPDDLLGLFVDKVYGVDVSRVEQNVAWPEPLITSIIPFVLGQRGNRVDMQPITFWSSW
jgi:hypothetical protein